MDKVAIIVGSVHDLPVAKAAINFFNDMEIPFLLRVLSAHRTPVDLANFIEMAEEDGTQVFIAMAGYAAALPGVVASQTIKPVLGVPISSSALNGIDSVLSILQMPGGVPVATFGLDKAGAMNAAIFAAQILAMQSDATARALEQHREEMRNKVLSANLLPSDEV